MLCQCAGNSFPLWDVSLQFLLQIPVVIVIQLLVWAFRPYVVCFFRTRRRWPGAKPARASPPPGPPSRPALGPPWFSQRFFSGKSSLWPLLLRAYFFWPAAVCCRPRRHLREGPHLHFVFRDLLFVLLRRPLSGAVCLSGKGKVFLPVPLMLVSIEAAMGPRDDGEG